MDARGIKPEITDLEDTCTCAAPGFCGRHQFEKNEKLFRICQKSLAMRQHWDRMREAGWRPSLVTQAKNFATAAAAGKLKITPRSPAEQQHLLNEYCKVCPTQQWNGEYCLKCQCPVSDATVGEQRFFNKLARGWCPDGHWADEPSEES